MLVSLDMSGAAAGWLRHLCGSSVDKIMNLIKTIFSAAAVYNRLYSKLSTNQKQSYICKSSIYAHWNGLSKLSTTQKQFYICKSAIYSHWNGL